MGKASKTKGRKKNQLETVSINGNRITYPDGTIIETNGHEVRLPGCEPTKVTEQDYRAMVALPIKRLESLWLSGFSAEDEVEIVRSMCFYCCTGTMPQGISIRAQSWTEDYAAGADTSRKKAYAAMCKKKLNDWRNSKGIPTCNDDADEVDEDTGEVYEQPAPAPRSAAPQLPTNNPATEGIKTLSNGRQVKYNTHTDEWNDVVTGDRVDIQTGKTIDEEDNELPF